MYTDVACYDAILNKETLISTIFGVTELHLSGVSIPLSVYQDAREFLSPGFITSTPIDFPYGLADLRIKIAQIVRAKQYGYDAVDFTPNFYFINNKNYADLRNELIAALVICKQEKLSLRIFLDYRFIHPDKFDHICKILANCGIEYAITSTGVGLVSFEDSVLAAVEIQKNGISPILNCNVYKDTQMDTIFKLCLFGIRFTSINIAKQKIWCNK